LNRASWTITNISTRDGATIFATKSGKRVDRLAVGQPRRAGAPLRERDRRHRRQPDQQGDDVGAAQRAEADVAEVALDEAVGQRADGVGERADALVAQHGERDRAEHEHPRQRDDERRDAEVGDPVPLERADQRARADGREHRQRPRHVQVHHQHGRDRPGGGHHRARRQVDVPGDDDQDHPDGEDQDVGVLHDDVGDVLRSSSAPFVSTENSTTISANAT
jgi:hypothetical protein